MNIVRELRKKKGIQQKELALAIGVSRPTVSDWESNKKDPTGERLKKLAEYFDVDELVILGKGVVDLNGQGLPEPADTKMILKVYDAVSDDRSDQERKKVENRLIRGQNGGQKEKGSPEAVEK